MPIYVGVNGEAKLVTEAYIGNRNNQAVPLYLSNIIPKTHVPANFIYTTSAHGDAYSTGLINTSIIPTAYTKIILVFAFYYNTSNTIKLDGVETSKVFLSNCDRATYLGNDSYYDICVGLNISHTSPKLYLSNGSIEKYFSDVNLIEIDNLNTAPENYYTIIINYDSSKKTLFKHNNDSFVSLGYNSNSSYRQRPISLITSPYMPICYCAIYRNLLTDITPTKEYLPCIRKFDGFPGIYESVEGVFYTSEDMAASSAMTQYLLPSFEEETT